MDEIEKKEVAENIEKANTQSTSENGNNQDNNAGLIAIAIVFLVAVVIVIAIASNSSNSREGAGLDSVATTAVAETEIEQSAEVAYDSLRWQVTESIDEMTDTKNVWKSLTSENFAYFDFPYEGGSFLRIDVRYMKKYGTDILLTLSQGQLMSNEYNGTNYVMVRFDDDAPQKYYTNEPSDGSSNCLFLRNTKKFIKRAKTAKSIKIQVPVFQEGNPIFTFKVDVPLTWEY